jgi:hypothetical protein
VVVERQVGARTLRARCEPRNEQRAASALSAFERLGQPTEGAELRFGWSAFRLADDGGGVLRACEPDFDAWPEREWRATIDVTLDVVEAQTQLLRSTGAKGEDVAFDQVVLAAPGAIEEPRAFMRRTEALAPEDSGWLVGALDDPEALSASDRLEAVAIAALVRRRAGLLPALTLPKGCVAIVTGASVETVLDPAGRELL